MPLGHKLPHRQALLFALALAFVMSCELRLNGVNTSVTELVVSPSAVTLQPDQVQDFTAVGFTATGDTAPITVTWSATGGTVDTNSAGGRHYGHYHNGNCGHYTVTAASTPGNLTASANVTVACATPVATVTVSPGSVSVQVGQSSQLTATPEDANGNPLTGRAITWSSSDPTIATVSGSGLVTGVAAGGPVTITATSEGQSGTASVTVTTVPVASVTVTPPSASVQVGQTVQLTATLKDANGNILTGRTVTWSSNQTTIATVNGSGRVTARAVGSATITATSEGQSGTSSITVTPVPVASVTVTPASASVAVGATVQLTATPKDASGNPLTGRVITWQSSNTTIASVNGTGLVNAAAAGGPVTITATSEGQSGSASVTVTAVPVASVTVTPPSASVQVGQTVQLTATLKDANGNILTGRTVTWSSNQTTIATVNSSGRVTARAAGSATITATSEGQSGTSSITVTPVPVASVTVTPASASVAVGATVQLTATPKDANGNPLTGRVITWSSSGTAIATVSGSGLVTGVAAGGPVTITATSEGRSGSAAVTVTTASAGRFGHVIIVAEENHDYGSVIGNAAMPYLNGLSTQYGLATNYYANAHPSMGNYFELTVGDTIINDDNFTGTVSNDNIIRELVNGGKTWKAYIEGYPSYDANHVPMSYFSDIRNNPAQAAKMVPFTQFATDLANGTLPDFSFITPNLCNDAHNCALGTADTWLQTNIDPLIQSAQFQQDGLLIIWWDESAGSSTNGGGKVAWTVVSPFAKRGYQSTTFYQHQSTLRLMLRALGVSTYPGDAASAPDMSEFFTIALPTTRGSTTRP